MADTNIQVDKFDRIWNGLSTADRIVLLGHDRDTLTAADKIRLAKVAAALARKGRQTRGSQHAA